MANEPTDPGKAPLPSFENPPLDEMVIGVQFPTLKKLTTAHLGRFWNRIHDKYPQAQDAFPLARQLENQDPQFEQPFQFIKAAVPAPRCWFLSSDGTQLLQVQNDRVLRNWRRVTGTERYPRYQALLDAFFADLDRFVDYVKTEKLGEITVDQCDLTYINQIDREAGWASFADLNHLFTCLKPAPAGVLQNPETLAWNATYKLPTDRGRLYVTIAPTIRARDFKMTVTVQFVARGAPAANSGEALSQWFDMAHEWIARAFDELTGPELHALWKKVT